jgi:hypothetical protein
MSAAYYLLGLDTDAAGVLTCVRKGPGLKNSIAIDASVRGYCSVKIKAQFSDGSMVNNIADVSFTVCEHIKEVESAVIKPDFSSLKKVIYYENAVEVAYTDYLIDSN